jgi:NAD(P)-dependent dehydrogenase (short-subunit alcohol dehydrogenase family)
MELEGKVAVILGASEEGGMGWATAKQLAAEGAKVVVAARRENVLREIADKAGFLPVVCDASKNEDIAALAAAAVRAYGKIDIAVNCAFIAEQNLIEDFDEEMFTNSLNVNFIGQVHFVRHMSAAMKDGGSIILISSQASAQPFYGAFAYGCAKAATDCLVRYAAAELGARGIRVNSILPGPVKTGITTPFLEQPEISELFLREIPLSRMGVPEDYAKTVSFLAKPGFITGVNLPVSGGMHLYRVPNLPRYT